MSDDNGAGAGDDGRRAAERGLSPGFERRLREARARAQTAQARDTSGPQRSEAMGAGLRIAVELTAAVGVGTGIGIVLDRWLGTQPWLLIVFFILGCMAGFLNVYRTAQELDRRARERKAEARGGPRPGPPRPDETRRD